MKKVALQPLADSTLVETGGTLLSGLLRKDLNVLMACGGKGLCSTCHVWVKRGGENLSPVADRERRTLSLVADARPESRLACQCRVHGEGVEVEVPKGMYIESADDLVALLGTRAEVNILHPVTAAVLIAKGKLITRTMLEQSRGVAQDLQRARAGGAETDTGSQRVFLASGVGTRPVFTTTTHHASRTVYEPGRESGAIPVPPSRQGPSNPPSTTFRRPNDQHPPSESNPLARPGTATNPVLHLSTAVGNPAARTPGGGDPAAGLSTSVVPPLAPPPDAPPARVAGGTRSVPVPLQPGSQIGKYLLIECIGKGGAGVVYRALHTKLKTPVAVKFLRPEVLAGDPDALGRFTHEAQLLAQLIHPNVVRVLDYEDEPTRPYVVMEYVDGLSAADLLKQCGRVAPERATGITLDVIDGLDAARKIGVVHRDVKPGNVLLPREGPSKLVDLGLAVVARSDTSGGVPSPSQSAPVEGTVGYMPPEQALGSTVDHRSDQYSLGCTLYHLVTGQLPFAGRSVPEVIMAHLRKPPTPPHEVAPGIPPALSRVILTMLEKSASDRYQDYATLRAELLRVFHQPPLP